MRGLVALARRPTTSSLTGTSLKPKQLTPALPLHNFLNDLLGLCLKLVIVWQKNHANPANAATAHMRREFELEKDISSFRRAQSKRSCWYPSGICARPGIHVCAILLSSTGADRCSIAQEECHGNVIGMSECSRCDACWHVADIGRSGNLQGNRS